MTRVAIVGSGLGGFVAYATLRHAGLAAGRDRRLRPRRRPGRRPGGRGRRRSGSGGCAPRATATAPPPRSPGSPCARPRAGAIPCPLVLSVLDRYRPTVDEFLATSPSCASAAAGTRASCRRAGRPDPRRRRRLRARRHGVFRHVLVATGHPGLAVRTSSQAIRGWSTPTSRTSTPHGRRRRRRDGGGDRMAERARGRLRVSRCAGASRRGGRSTSPGRSSASAASPASTPRRAERAALLHGFGEPSYPPGRALGRPDRGGRARRPLPRRTGGRRRRAGDLRDGLSARLPARSAAGAARRRARARDARSAGSSSRHDSTVPGAHRRDAHAGPRRRARRSGRTRRRTRSSG